MLKSLKITAVVAIAYASVLSSAQAGVAEDLQNICTIVKADDKSELRKKMKKVESDYRLKLQDYYTGISCEGESLIRIAFLNNALETGELMIKKMPKSLLNAAESDGKTLRAWVSEHKLMTSPIANVLNERI
ncbi:MAG: DUF3718 domain-containing protein [Alteromonadaceae bacterium]|jgi:predicted methyltransferase|uniref:DUF3718 domain-containing protein n=1 Tax=Paraglaciecola agarilytica NO2 TaxID=1125747 RepID=A0ABQ0I9B3_9ALTE|nr:DUF3718 domain-containing protein [Paraglaciecola agarilytica]AEE24773.1 hypothetical protein Glaag_3846 [Glaciecola sp. 4H-3-7+YE-5]MBN25444.1 DUF3718 domain-containing protein [Alteromonadaceae bacterium]GAC05875.1 hypothetical protein GAGA_3041 [Paraglaciecola agarilytica NO2]|tara:strand:+ start:7112 stop:7507 length:396 start_codon:yes stop_codon:yes gene_type:complete